MLGVIYKPKDTELKGDIFRNRVNIEYIRYIISVHFIPELITCNCVFKEIFSSLCTSVILILCFVESKDFRF